MCIRDRIIFSGVNYCKHIEYVWCLKKGGGEASFLKARVIVFFKILIALVLSLVLINWRLGSLNLLTDFLVPTSGSTSASRSASLETTASTG